MNTISIIIPTVKDRKDSFHRTIDAYVDTLRHVKFEFIIVRDKATCGEAWEEGINRATSPVVHLTADDISPVEGWSQAALSAVAAGILPAPKVYSPNVPHQASHGHNGDGQLLPLSTLPLTACNVSVIPTFRRDLWPVIGPMLPLHYYSDDYLSHRARKAGLRILTWPGYEFTHWFESGGARPDMADRINRDRATYYKALEAGS